MSLRDGIVIGIGNPLLDISAVVDTNLLDKYNMKPNNAIMADECHMPLFKDLPDNYNVEYIAGGSVQNSLRVAQWFLQRPNVCSYFGCVGQDKFAQILKERASAEGVNVQYQVTDQKPTGTCAVLITGTQRSLCANLAAAQCFTEDHLDKPECQKLIQDAEIFYASGYFFAVSPSSIMRLAKRAQSQNHTMILNISAPFVSQFYKDPLLETLPYVDILFGNETEMETFAKETNLGLTNLTEIAVKISTMPKVNTQKSRTVIITQGGDPVIIAVGGKVHEIPVPHLPKEKFVDTNGAGDAFVGGFLAQLILKKSVDECVKCGIYAASVIIQRSGCTFSGKPQYP